jgi:phosphoglycerate dehydrogenase-like enzyme
MQPNVLITDRLDPDCAAWLAERCEVGWVPHDDPAALAEHLPSADGLVVRTYTRVDEALLQQAPRLKVVGRAGVGLDNFDLPACAAAGVQVVYTPDANTQAVVEYVTGLMLDHVRPRTPLPAGSDADTFHHLRKTEVGRQLDQLTLGLVGFGRIGKRLGAVAHALGMNLRVCDLLPEAQLRKAVDYPFDYVDHETLYAGCDVLSVHVDGRPENRHLLDAAALTHLRPHTLLINAARGLLIDHAALTDWARDHPEATAVLDVHDPEPPPADSPLHDLDNVTLLPHLASRTGPALKNMSWVVRDVAQVLQGRPPQHPAPTG